MRLIPHDQQQQKKRKTSRKNKPAVVGGCFPTLRGERTEMGGRFRQDAYESVSTLVSSTCQELVRSLCREKWTEVADWLAAHDEDPEAPARVAVVRPQFCEGARNWASSAMSETRESATVLTTEDDEDRSSGLVVVEDAERWDSRRLSECCSKGRVVLMASSHWSLPSWSSSPHIFAREFFLPSFERFADAFLKVLIVERLPLAIGPSVMDHWIESIESDRSAAAMARQIDYLLFVHFYTRPNSFLVTADSVQVAEREGANPSVLLYLELARLSTAMTESALDAMSCDWKAKWTTACCSDAKKKHVSIRRCLNLLDLDMLGRVLREWIRLVADCRRTDALRKSRGVRLALAKFRQLEVLCSLNTTIFEEGEGRRRRQLNRAVLQVYDLISDQAQLLDTIRGSDGAFFDDKEAVAKPFKGDMWSNAIQALSGSTKDARCVAFQVVSDENNVDLDRWYKILQTKVDDDETLSCSYFACIVRDLAYTGLVRDRTKRGKYMVCGV